VESRLTVELVPGCRLRRSRRPVRPRRLPPQGQHSGA